jgi:FeS assembly protein IscX
MRWNDVSDIAVALSERYPTIAPLSVRFTDLHRYVCELPGFDDAPERSNEKVLEAIQMAWLDEFED